MSQTASPHDIAVVGRSCRLPGATSVPALWRLLLEERCAVSSVPGDRWPLERHWHPRIAERGRTYTWAAGVLDDIWGFDPAAFGISPREAEQMDPQQRLLLELTWEALEDAGRPPSKLAGTETGVFVGASSVDHANLRLVDMAAADAYMMTGNTLSVIANRISYVFDLKGPSLTIDTACSSSLVAVNEAIAHLRSGRVETAIVAGVNLLVSPQSFIGFSQAGMLSPRGLCQAFSAQADGYVRAEGGVVLVLKTMAAAERDGSPIYGVIVDAGVNSDGRTNGISLPSQTAQARLLEQLYNAGRSDPAALAFVEAHGTGTPVGDPIEAAALGETLGRRRDRPLLIGSLKTNIGHMEAAAGLGGLLKAMLALEHDQLPASLHSADLNPAIDFAALNVEVARRLTPLARHRDGRRLAGVNAFGFGGTNAHVILADPPSAPTPQIDVAPSFLVLSAHSRAAIGALATAYAGRLHEGSDTGALALVAATATRRDRLAHRIVMPVDTPAAMATRLASVAHTEDVVAGAARGIAPSGNGSIAFVFSGNGSQFAGMGLPAYRHNVVFRDQIDAISTAFESLAGWSIVEALHAADLGDRLRSTRIAQPLLFAIQSAACTALLHLGLAPAMVLGHSVGEVAAAEAAGFLDRESALRTIHARSLHQELTFGHGGMAVIVGSQVAADAILADLPGLEIAADNSPRARTVAGGSDDLARLPGVARRHGARIVRLDLAYPFHTGRMQPVRQPLKESLAGLAFGTPHTPFLSTVDAEPLGASAMDADYWWRNVREPVRFAKAIEEAGTRGAGIFVEIGPMATLLSHIGDTLADRGQPIATLAALEKRDTGVDPLAMAVASAIARGASVDERKLAGSGLAAGAKMALPHYPWQRQSYRLAETIESTGRCSSGNWHPLIGARTSPDGLEWQTVLDTTLQPWLADHCVEGRAILPGAAFVEMALAVAREWNDAHAIVSDIEIASPLQLAPDASREILCRVSPVGRQIEILSRPRLSAVPWQLHATATFVRDATSGKPPRLDVASAPQGRDIAGDAVYAWAERAGLVYGPAFRKLAKATRTGAARIALGLTNETASPRFGIDPAQLDACFHALALLFDPHDRAPRAGFVPVRFGEMRLCKPSVAVARAEIEVLRHDERAIVVNVVMADAAGETVAVLSEARFRPLPAHRSADRSQSFIERTVVLAAEPTAARRDRPLPLDALRAGIVRPCGEPRLADSYVLLEGWATSLAFDVARGLAVDGIVDVDDLVTSGAVPRAMRSWVEGALVALHRSGLCRSEGPAYAFDRDDNGLPSPDEILRMMARQHQALALELLVATSTRSALSCAMAGEAVAPLGRIAEEFEASALQLRHAALALAKIIETSRRAWPGDRAMRILQVGHGPLTALVADLSGAASARHSIFDPDHRRLERARIASADGSIELIGKAEDLPSAAFDLVVSASPTTCSLLPAGTPAALRRAMGAEAILAVIEPAPSLFRDLVRRLDSALDEATDAPRIERQPDWQQTALDIGLEAIAVDEVATPAGPCRLLTARAPAERRHRAGSGRMIIIGDAARCPVQTSFATLVASSGVHVSILRDVFDAERTPEMPCAIVAFMDYESHPEPATRLLDHCLRLKGLSERFAGQAAQLWIVTTAEDDATETNEAIRAFSRTLANEVPSFDVRRVEASRNLAAGDLAERLRDLVLSQTDETEVVLDVEATQAVRFAMRPAASAVASERADAARLQRAACAGGDQLAWQATERVAPGPGEVEIGVEAVGVNFRDVMFGLGLLPDDVLEHGFAGPTLGLECVGRVLRVGESVASPKPGERVMAFARNAFATHALMPAALTAPLPEGISTEAAATIPVAFITAYYGLITCARLKPREWVLIHGGAGGVGLAALQIARWRGARVIGTAGSPGKRALLGALGADHVFDSRSGSFVDDVRRVTGEGVAVVLNSLSGEAMERSIGLLRPFGRFVELGKRDYVANTHIGLRPFRRNLTYMGVDLDQLLVDEPRTSRRLFQAVMRLFKRGVLAPLPFRTFEAAQTVEAFRLMQQSGHVGKLVVYPPDPARIAAAPRHRILAFAADKAHLVTGGFGGFGLATARWLAAHGARTIVLIGRQGPASAEAARAVEELTAQGVRVEAEAADVTDRPAMARLFARFGADLPRLGGVFHAAMVLDDALLTHLTPERIERVLRPKVAGAALLDELTRDIALDHFVLYSSVTTLLGNPGQAAYVAANGYLEGLARRRRRAGLPGLAVIWGAIADVGILAHAPATRHLLEDRAGVKSISAQEALRCLGHLLAAPREAGEQGDEERRAVVAIAPMNWSTARQHLPVLAAPAYRALMSQDEVSDPARKMDIAALVAGSTPEAAHEIIAGLIVEEIARVLRLPSADVARTTPLANIGLDSLMAVELALGLEGRFTLVAPLSSSASSFSVNELADHVIAIASGTPTSDDARARQMIGRHVDTRLDDAADEAASVHIVEDRCSTQA